MLPFSRAFFRCAASVSVALLCAGTLHAQATLTPASHDFGSIALGQSSNIFNFTFTNNSSASEMVSSISTNITPVSEFSSPGNTCIGPAIAAHGTCTISVIFSPSALGLQSSTLTVNSTDATNPMLTASLTGTGVAAVTSATLTPASWTFPSTTVGNSSASQQFVLTNTGNTTIGNISFGTSSDYSATPICGTPAMLALGASCNINVVFSPTAAGTRPGTLTVNFTNSSGPLTSSLTGTGISNLSGLTLSTYSLSMGSYQINAGASPAMAVTLTNNDSTTITFAAPVGANGAAFPVSGDFSQTNTCAQTLAAGASCSANITFQPAATGTRIGSLTVQSTATNGTQTLTLSGIGTDYTITTTTPSVTVVQGSTAVYPIAFTPISGYSSTITLSCTGLNAVGTSCAGNSPVTLGPGKTANFSITTTPKNVGGVIANGVVPHDPHAPATWAIGICGLLLLTLTGRARRLARSAGVLALLLGLLWPTGGCSGKQPTPDPDATVPGTYTFTLTAVDTAHETKTLALTLVVTSQ